MKSAVFFCAVLFITWFTGSGCKPEEQEYAVLELEISHSAAENPLNFDSIQYLNHAGNRYSLSRLMYFISGISLRSDEGLPVYLGEAFYIDARKNPKLRLNFTRVPKGRYLLLTFNIGLLPELNSFGNLPNTAEINAMYWPVNMGGGYHFLKMEGHFLDKEGQVKGYAMHTGTNVALVPVQLPLDFSLNNAPFSLKLEMQVEQWFKDPHTIDLDSMNYSMGDSSAMARLSMNGRNAFKILNP